MGAKKEPSRWVKVILKLTELTQKGELDWRINGPVPEPTGKDVQRAVAYRTRYREWILRISKYKILYRPSNRFGFGTFESSEGDVILRHDDIGFIGTTFSQSEPSPFWSTKISLEIITADGEALYRIPETDGLSGLYSAIQYRVANAGGFLKTFMEEGEKGA